MACAFKALLLSRADWCVCISQSCPTLWDPMDCSLPGSSDHGISLTRIMEWDAISYSRGSFCNSCLLTQEKREVQKKFTLYTKRKQGSCETWVGSHPWKNLLRRVSSCCTRALAAVVLKLYWVSELPGGLVKTYTAGNPHPSWRVLNSRSGLGPENEHF